MTPSTRLLLALLALAPSALPAQSAPASETPAAEPPEKIVRFEQMLVRSPGPGRAFDEVFGHWFAAGGPAALEARWRAARNAAPAGSPAAIAYGLLLGQLAERVGDAASARARYTEVAAAAPADFRAHHRLGRLEIREGRLAPGIAALEKAAALDLPPADAQDVLRDLARARSRAMDEAGALAAWKKLGEKFPDDAILLEEVGQAQLDAAAYDDAAATFAALEKAAAGDAYRAVLARLRLGEVAAKKGDKDAALARFSAALDGTHRDSWLHREARARVDALFRERGDFDGLVAFHEGRLQGTSRDPAAARQLAELLLELGRNDPALAWFDKAAGWAPDDHALRFAQIRAMLAAGKGDDALPLLEALVKRQPKENAYREALGQLHWDRAKAATDDKLAATERAAALETWAALAPAGAPVADLLALAEVYRSRGLDEETRAVLARALAAEPASYDLRERLALQLLAMKRDAEAWSVARNEPKGLADAGQYRRLAQLEKRQSLLEPALVSIDRGLKLAPGNFELLDLRWQVLAELQRWDDAIALFPALRAGAPGDYALSNVENRHVQALRSAGKLDAELAALAARVAAEDPALTEADHRLHLRLVLAQPIPLGADAAFAAARKRFPDSFSIAQIETEHLERAAPLAARVEALRRLAALRPDRAAEWQRRIVGAYRLEGDYVGARRAVAELLALAPSDAQNHVLSADLEFEAGAPADGVASLQRALRLAADPAPVRFRLARAFLEQNKPAAALQIFEESYYDAKDDGARRGLIAPLVEAATIAGDFEGLVARYQERNRPRRDSADYHLDLGEFYFQARDQGRARESWTKALDLRRDDIRLIGRLLELARQNGEADEVARLAQLRYERDASPQNAIDLGEALLNANQPDKALELFVAQAAYFFKDTTLLPRILPNLAGQNLAQPLIDRLRAVSASADDSADRDLVLATALVTAKDYDGAERLLWQVYERPVSQSASPAPAPASPPPTAPGAGSTLASATPPTPQAIAFQSVQTTNQAYYSLTQILQNQGGGGYRISRGYYGGQQLPPSPTQTQDTALGYLGALALQRDRAAAFVDRLGQSLEKRGLPVSARLLEYAKIQAREQVRRDIDAALAEPAPNLQGLICARNYLAEPYDHRTGMQPEPTPEMAARIARLDEILAKLSPQSVAQTRMQGIYAKMQAKKPEEALAAARELENDPKLSEPERRQASQLVFNMLVENARWTEAADQLRAQLQSPALPGVHPAFYLLTRYLQRAPDTAGGKTDPAFISRIADLLVASAAHPVPAAPGMNPFGPFGRRGSNLQGELQQMLSNGAPIGLVPAIPPGQFWFPGYLNGDSASTNLLIDALLEAAARNEDENARVAGQALAFIIAFQGGDNTRAEKIGEELLARRPDAALAFNLAEIALRDDRADVARKRYEAIQNPVGAMAIAIQARLLEIALREESTRDDAKAAAARLVALRPPQYLPNLDLDSTLQELGLTPPPRQSNRSGGGNSSNRSRHEEINRLSNELNELTNKKDYDGAERVALRLIREITPQQIRQGNDWGRRRGYETLVRIGRIDAYIADLEAALARSPGSTLLLEQLADAHGAIRQNSDRNTLGRVAATPEAPALPLRLRLARRGDTLVASHAALPAPHVPTEEETAAPAGAAPAELSWTELGSIELKALGDASAGLVARNQNFKNLDAGLFADPVVSGAPVADSALKNRDTLRVGDRNVAFHAFDKPLADGAVVEVTLRPAGPTGPRPPAERGLLLRDPADKSARVSLALDADGKLVFSARRHTGRRELEYLSDLVSRGRAEDRLRERYVNALFEAGRADDALAFVLAEPNADLLSRFANNDSLLGQLRKSGKLSDFVDRVVAKSLEKNRRPNQYPQIDYQVAELARRLRRSKDNALSLRVWDAILASAPAQQSAEFRAEYMEALMAADPAAARARLVPLVTNVFIRPVAESRPRSAAFDDSLPRYQEQPWYSNGGYWNYRAYLPALQVLDSITDPAVFRDLLAENAPRLAAAGDSRDPRYYDFALRLSALDPSLPAALTTAWGELKAAQKNPKPGNQYSPQAFFGVALTRLASWPDPRGEIETLFNAILADLPALSAPRNGYRMGGGLFIDNYSEAAIRLAWGDYWLARGDAARFRAALADLAQTFARQDPRQVNESLVHQLLARLLARGEIAEARRLYDTSLRRFYRATGNRRGNGTPAHLAAFLAAMEGAALKPAPAVWAGPADTEGSLELRWEIGASLEGQGTDSQPNWLPPVFGRDRDRAPDGAYDLLVEIAAGPKGEPAARVELPAVAARGRHVLAAPLPAGQLRATLRPRDGSAAITLPAQVFSTRPNLVANPALRVTPAAKPGEFHQLPGWTGAISPVVLAGGPSGGLATRIELPPRNNNEKLVRSAPIPIDPKTAYLLQGWAGLFPDEYNTIGVEILNAAGEVLEDYNVGNLRNPELRWQRFAQTFGPSSRNELPARRNLPEKAAALRITLGGAGLSLSELSLRELPPAPPPPPPAPAPSGAAPTPPAPLSAPAAKPQKN